MRYGICILPEKPWRIMRPLWERAEAMGFDHAWTYDHLVWGGLPDSQWFSCMPTLTAAAMATSRIGLGAFVVSPNFRHPATLAREIQTVADIADGRLLVGLGAGGTPDDTILGAEPFAPRERVDRLQEFTSMLDRALDEDHLTTDGEYYRIRDLRLVGGSVRSRIPLILAGNGPRSVRFAAAHGDGWVTTGPARSGAADADDLDEWFGGVARSSSVFDRAVAASDRGTTVRRYLSLDAAPVNSLESLDLFDDMVGRAAELGFTDVIVHWPRDTEPYRASEAVLDEVAASRLPH